MTEETKQKQKLPPEDWKSVKLDVLKHSLDKDIQAMSFGQTEQEVLDYWGLEYDLLEGNDKWFFDFHFRRGQAEARKLAVDTLFKTMKGRNGKDASMAYLLRFNEDWDEDVEDKTQGRRYILQVE